MKYRMGTCSACSNDRIIVKRSPSGNYCVPCNKKRLGKRKEASDSGKTLNAEPKNFMILRRKSGRMKEAAGKSIQKAGQAAMFDTIWATRKNADGKRVSAISGDELKEFRKTNGTRGSMWYSQFFHILPKGTYPAYKLDDRNLILTTVDEHNMWHQNRDQCRKDPAWDWVFELYQELQLEDTMANRVRKIK